MTGFARKACRSYCARQLVCRDGFTQRPFCSRGEGQLPHCLNDDFAPPHLIDDSGLPRLAEYRMRRSSCDNCATIATEGRDCPICNGDCSAANPPVLNCPIYGDRA